jgi:hypothetical protein
MAARLRPAAKDKETGRFKPPLKVEDSRGEISLYFTDLDTEWADKTETIPGWRGWLGTQICRGLGVGPL